MTTLAPSVEDQLSQLAAQVEQLTAELQAQRRQRERWSELTADLTPVAGEAVQRFAVELGSLGLTAEELVEFLRALAVSLPDVRAGLRQLSSLADLARTVAPLSGPAVDGLTARLAEMDSMGHFEFARSGAGVINKVIAAFGEADIDALGDNVVLILNTVKEMTQPEVMQMLQRTMHTVQSDEPTEPPSLFRILGELRDPEVRLGLHRILTALRSVGATQTDSPTHE